MSFAKSTPLHAHTFIAGRRIVPVQRAVIFSRFMKRRITKFLLTLVLSLCAQGLFAAPTVSNVTFAQRTDGSKLVDVFYDLADTVADATSSIALGVSSDNGVIYAVPINSVTGAVGDGIVPGTGKRIVWDAGQDFVGGGSSNVKVRVTALLDGAGGTFAPIPAGTYQIGNAMATDTSILGSPLTSVTLSEYHLSVNHTTEAQWDVVRTWGLSNGYTDLPERLGKASNHPVQTVSWYAVVKWANAASGYGLKDMAGNVAQWCWDWYGTYSGGSDPKGAATGSNRVLRGGEWYYEASIVRCAQRSMLGACRTCVRVLKSTLQNARDPVFIQI
jgi:hypothetical protein